MLVLVCTASSSVYILATYFYRHPENRGEVLIFLASLFCHRPTTNHLFPASPGNRYIFTNFSIQHVGIVPHGFHVVKKNSDLRFSPGKPKVDHTSTGIARDRNKLPPWPKLMRMGCFYTFVVVTDRIISRSSQKTGEGEGHVMRGIRKFFITLVCLPALTGWDRYG